MEVEAQGKMFTFPEGTSNAQIGEAVDDYFANNPVKQPVAAEQTNQQPVDFDLGTMVGNIPSSAGGMAVDIYNAIRNPKQTASAVGDLAQGAIDKGAHALSNVLPDNLLTQFAQGGESGVYRNPVWGKEKMAEAVGQFVADRYGSEDALKKTIMEDPVGVLGDFAGVLSGGSLAIPKYGTQVGKVASMIDPVNLAIRGTSKAVMNTPGLKNLPANLYKSAAKFGKKFDQTAVTATALRERILPTDAGIAVAKEKITGIDQQITDLITESANSGKKIPRSKMYKYLKEVRKEIGGFNLDAPDNLKKMNKVVSDFEEFVKGKGMDNITAKQVQEFKSNIYKTLNWKAKQGTGSQAKSVTRKAIARAAKDELEIAMPEIKGLNLRMGDILELLDAIDAPAARISNRDIVGLGIPAKVIAGSMVGDASGAAAGLFLGLIDSPTVKAKLAMGLNRIKNMKVSSARKRVLAVELIRGAGAISQPEQDEQP